MDSAATTSVPAPAASRAADHLVVARSNRRGHRRCPLPAAAAYLSGHRVLIARLGDLSVGGAFLHTQFPDPVGTQGRVELEVGGERAWIEVEVVRVSFDRGADGAKCGMGVAFLALPLALRRALQQRTASSR